MELKGYGTKGLLKAKLGKMHMVYGISNFDKFNCCHESQKYSKFIKYCYVGA